MSDDEQQQEEVRPETAAAPPLNDIVVSVELRNIIEALVFASDEPMTVRFIRSIMDDVNKDLPPAEHYSVNADIIRKAVADLNRTYGRMGMGFRIIEIAGGFTYATKEEFSSWVGKLAKEKARRRLSPTAVESLAIIAYKQPITKGEVEFIRGVNVDYIINALLEKDLIHISGRATTPGRPLLYSTTQKFLEHFGLNDLTDLPKPREIAELINETEIEVDRRLLAEQQEMEFKEDLEKKNEGHEGAKQKGQRGPKAKVPDDVKEENRRAARQQAPEQPAAAPQDGATAVPTEGVTPSDTISVPEETAAAPADIPAVPVPTENREAVLPESGASAEEAEEIAETISEEAAEVFVTDADREAEESIAAESIAEPEPEEIAVSSLPVEDSAEIVIVDAPVEETVPDSVKEEPLQDSDVPAEAEQEKEPASAAVPEISAPEVPAENVPDVPPIHRVYQDEMADSASGAEENDPSRGDSTDPAAHPASETGWSKWKNKVKTFFQKIFG